MLHVSEWSLANDHLVDQDTNTPIIYCFAIPFTTNQFRRKKYSGVPHKVCVRFFMTLLRPKINNSQVSLIINQNIFGLHVSIHDIVAVNVRKCANDTCTIKTMPFEYLPFHSLVFLSMKTTRPADHLEKHIQCLLVLKCCFQMQDKWMVQHC